MNLNFIFILVSVIIFSHPNFPQVDSLLFNSADKYIVDSITIQGNDITEEEIILRELTFSISDTITQKLIEYNKERIYSLGLFTKVDLFLFPVNKKNVLVINVEESWYIYPIPVASLRDNDWDKLSYGFYLVVKNFRGRNETLISRVELGYDPALQLSYYKPNVIPGSDYFWGADILYKRINNKSISAAKIFGGDFNQKFIIGSLEFGKRFGTFQRLSARLSYNYVESPQYFPLINSSEERVDRYPSIGIGYSYDTRDLAQFPKEGILGTASLEFKGLGLNDISYQVFGLDYREYRNVFDDLTAKWRFAARFTSGKKIPYYDYSILGYDEKIRGNYDLKLEGHNYYVGSLEFFYPLLKDINISLDFIPILPKELLSYRVALYLELFGDTGTTKLLGKELNIKDFRSGYGVGLSLLVLPYNILRFEIAFDEYRNSEFILGLGLSF